jgi:peptidoglycan/xylan/chitin deacetylase (PgdA/CDA1 family)
MIAACLFAAVLAASPREVAVTFDDLPATPADLATMTEVTSHLLRSLKANRGPAIGFVNARKVEGSAAGVALLRQWLDAGFDLGNHTWSHVSIDSVPFETYRADLIRGEPVLKRLLAERGRGQRLRYFRHPQLHTGPTPEIRKQLNDLLASRGYTVAPVTIDNDDYLFARVYQQARTGGDQALMKRVVDAYIPYMNDVFAHFERLSREFLGREVKQTLLLHANELNADHFDELAAMMRQRGYTFISLDRALTDPAYRMPEATSTKGISWLHRWMLAKGLPMQPEPREPEFIRTSSSP